MADRRSIIGQVHNDQHRGPRTTGFHGSENGDGYLSDVQTLNSNNPSEVSQDFHSSARLLEQLFNDKCNFIRDSYDQRSRQLSDVVNKLCEELVSDEVLQEMKSDRTSSAYIPAHLGEVINRHLEDNREQFIHRLITQLSEARSGLVKLKDQAIQRNRFIDSLEPEIVRGKKALNGMDGLQRQLTDMKRQYDNLQHHSQEKIRKLKMMNDQLSQKDNQLREQVQKLQVDLSLKSQAVESLQKDVDEKTRDSCFMESSYDRAVNDEVSMRILSISTEKMELSVQLGELKSELKVKSDQLVRSQDVLKLKEEEENKNKSQTASMMSQVQIILDQESNESNRTIAALYDKMKIFKSKICLELQQEKNVTTVLKNEMTVVRIEKDEKLKQFQKALIDNQNYKEKLSILVKESSALQIRYQECQTALRNSELDSNKAQSQIQKLQQELDFSTKLKEQELSVAFCKAKMQAVKELEHDRLQLDQEVLKRTESYIKNNENQLKLLHNQLRHSYSFGTATSTSNSQNNSNNNQSVVWGTAGNTALDLSVLVALKSAEDKANVSKIVLESEFLISKTKSDAKMENAHKEKVQEFELKLLEASGNFVRILFFVLYFLLMTSSLNIEFFNIYFLPLCNCAICSC